jgi:hypothetical protein
MTGTVELALVAGSRRADFLPATLDPETDGTELNLLSFTSWKARQRWLANLVSCVVSSLTQGAMQKRARRSTQSKDRNRHRAIGNATADNKTNRGPDNVWCAGNFSIRPRVRRPAPPNIDRNICGSCVERRFSATRNLQKDNKRVGVTTNLQSTESTVGGITNRKNIGKHAAATNNLKRGERCGIAARAKDNKLLVNNLWEMGTIGFSP